MSAVEVEGLTKKFDNGLALDSISFTVKTGEVFGFLGRNGAGKTTTIKILSTILPPSGGKALVFGYDVARDGMEIRKRIGLVQQRHSYEFSLTLRKQLDVYGRVWGLSLKERVTRADYLVHRFELEDSLDKTPAQMSIGQRRRMQIARELMHDMDLIFLDEPTTGLDVQSRRSTLDFFKEKAREGLTIFLTTHLLQEAEYICDRVAIIDHGKIAALDSVEGLKSKYTLKQVIELLASPVPLALSTLRKLSYLYEVNSSPANDGAITARFDSSDTGKIILEVVAELTREGVSVLRIGLSEPTLEDVFIDITRGAN
jgi:ABC-2 type transport system ATP-binding protein